MGLDTSHNAWHGPYSSFMRFRELLAKQIGFNLREMEGFSDKTHTIEGTKKWADLPKDDLHILLNHSDCDGHITAKRCEKLAKRLDEVLIIATEKVPEPDEREYWDYFLKQIKQFSTGCKLAHSKNEPLEFH